MSASQGARHNTDKMPEKQHEYFSSCLQFTSSLSSKCLGTICAQYCWTSAIPAKLVYQTWQNFKTKWIVKIENYSCVKKQIILNLFQLQPGPLWKWWWNEVGQLEKVREVFWWKTKCCFSKGHYFSSKISHWKPVIHERLQKGSLSTLHAEK